MSKYYALGVPEDDLNSTNYADMRMAMYRNRKGFGILKKGNLEIRNFAVDQYKKYMEQLDKMVYPEGHKDGAGILMEDSYGRSGIHRTEDLIYIDGMPAIEYVEKLGYKKQELQDYPEIVQAEIAAAMTGGRNHVDIMLPTINEHGDRVMQAHELRADVKDLDGKQGRWSSTRNARMESLYQSKNRESRLDKISAQWERKQNIKLLSEQILYNEGISGADLYDSAKFKTEKKKALKDAETAVKEMESGDTKKWSSINNAYHKNAVNKYMDACFAADELAMKKLGINDKSQYINAWHELGVESNVPTMDRPISRGANAVMYALYRNPSLQWNDIVHNQEKFAQAIIDYRGFLNDNKLDASRSPEQIAQAEQAQANYYKFARERMKDMALNYDVTKREERIRHIEQEVAVSMFTVNISQTEETLKKRPGYIESYGGKEAYEAGSSSADFVQDLNTAVLKSEDPKMDLNRRAGYLYGIKQYAPVLRNMNRSHMDEVAKFWNPLAWATEMAAAGAFLGSCNRKDVKNYMFGGPLPGDKAELKEAIDIVTKEHGGAKSCGDLLKDIDRINKAQKQKNAKPVKKQVSMGELMNQKGEHEPVRGRRKAIYQKHAPVRNEQKEMNPFAKK